MALDESRDDVADTARYDDDEEGTDEPSLFDDVPAAEPEPEEPTLDDLDPDVRERVEAYYARQQEQQRASFRELGLDLNQDGRPLIADAGKVSQWAGGLVQQPQQSRAPEPPPPAPPPAGAPPDDEPFDPLAADAQTYERFTERVAQRAVEKATGPLLAEIQRLQGMSQRRAESEAMSRVRDVVQQRAPELLPSMEHPDFEAGYRAEISKVQAEYLDDPATIGAIAALVRMRLDPARMPARSANPAAQSLAQNRANRAGLDQAPSARLGGAGASPADTDRRSEDAWGVRFLGRMREQMSDAQAARIEVSPEAWREVGEHQDFDSWKQARDARRERERRSGARRR